MDIKNEISHHCHFHYLTVVLQVSLVPKGFSGNFSFTEQQDTEELARITLPPNLFQEQGNYVNVYESISLNLCE